MVKCGAQLGCRVHRYCCAMASCGYILINLMDHKVLLDLVLEELAANWESVKLAVNQVKVLHVHVSDQFHCLGLSC